MSRTIQVTFDCADPNGLAGFWNEVLGYRYDSPPAGFATWEEALDHFNVPEEDRNNASASVDPDERGRGCSSRGCPRARPPRTASTSTCGPRRASRATRGWLRSRPSASGWWRSARAGCGDPSPRRR